MPTSEEILQYRISNVQKMKRVLDGPPRKFKVTPIGYTNIVGTAEVFAEVYNSVIEHIKPGIPCKLILKESEAILDDVPFACLKTLLLMNVSTNPELSKICVILFQKLVERTSSQTINNEVHITKDAFHDTVMNMTVSTVYANSLIKGIFRCAFPEDFKEKVWNDLLNIDKTRYAELRRVGLMYLKEHPELDTEDQITKALLDAYKHGCKSKGFMKQFAKDLSPAARGMAFLTFMNNPDVLRERVNGKDEEWN